MRELPTNAAPSGLILVVAAGQIAAPAPG